MIVLIAIAISVVMSKFIYWLLNKVPARWFCDYNEEPTADMLETRFKYNIVVNICLAICYSVTVFIFGWTLYSLLLILIIATLFAITLSDAKYKIIPDELTISVAVLCVLFAVLDYFTMQIFISDIFACLIGAICGGGLLILLNLLSKLLFKKEGIGFGDVKLLAALGIAFGFPMILVALALSVFISFFHIIILFIRKKIEENYLPLGPYIAIGSIVLFLLHGQIFNAINSYLSLFK